MKGRRPAIGPNPTITRIAQGLLSALRDFGVLQGAVNKKIAPAYFPIESFAYVVFYLKQHQPSGAKLIELPDWKLFFLHREKESNDSCLRPINVACWSTTWLAVSPG